MNCQRGVVILAFLGCCVLSSCAKQTPVLVIEPIPNGSVVTGVASFAGLASDRSGIRSVTLYVDAKPAAEASVRQSGLDGTKASPHAQDSAASKWRATIDTAPLAMGVHYLTVLAHAKNGAFTQQTVTMVVSR